MSISTGRLVRAAGISLQKRRNDEFLLADSISGKQFWVGHTTLEVLNYLDEPRYPDEICTYFEHVRQEDIENLIVYFNEHGLVYDPDDPDYDPSYQLVQPNQTFFNFERLENLPEETSCIAIAGLPFGKGNALSDDCDRAPAVLRRFTNSLNLNLRNQQNIESLQRMFPIPSGPWLEENLKNQLVADAGDLYFYQHELISHSYDKMERLAFEMLDKELIPAFIGGDHSVTLPTLKAIDQKCASFGVIHLDAHTDTYESKIEHSFSQDLPHHHGNFVSKALELENLDSFWQFGIRGWNNLGQEVISEKQHIFYAHEIPYLEEADLDEIPTDIPFWLTLDLDVISPEIAPATATPVPNGLQYQELLKLLQKLLAGKKLIGFDLVEIHPEKDRNQESLHLMTSLLVWLLGYCQTSKD